MRFDRHSAISWYISSSSVKKFPKHVSCISPECVKWPASQLVHTYRNLTPRQVLLERTRNLNLHLIVLHLITLSERCNL